MAAAPTTDDHAIVIGIRRYGDVAAGWVTNLEGPDNDAAAVADWLRSPTGGRLPAANVRVVRSADVPDPFGASGPEPHQRALIEALDEIAQLPTDRVDGQYAGRRLYVYVSGHGWAQRRDETALVTAEATRSNTLNVLVTSWIDWMYYAAPFKELVLWADTCATRTALTFLQPCRIPERMSPNKASVRMFTAFAAPLGLLAVENQMPDRQWHGAFTYALLQGLKGAAPGDVTSDSLSNYLRNTVKDFMRPEQRSSKTVAVEPAIGKTDPMVFATLPTPTFDVTLRFPQTCAGRLATIFTTRSQPAVAEMVLDGDAEWTVALEAGAYGVEVADLGISKAFEVTGGGVDEPIAVP